MSDFQPHSGYAPLSLVEGYWDALRAGREMPKRAEIDPRGIESALEYAFILERVAPGVARMRIAGSHLHDIMGMEARGMPLTSFFEQEARLKVSGLLEEVFQTPATAEVSMVGSSGPDQPAVEARMVLLPLKSDLGDVSRILGCMVCLGNMGAAPRRFNLRTVTVRSLGDRINPAPQPATTSHGFEEHKLPFIAKAPDRTEQEPQTLNKRPAYLRLITNDD